MALQKYIVSRDDSIYEAWPDVVQTASGKMICVFSECEHHLDRLKARITLRESQDRGRTWSEKHYLSERGTRESFYNCARSGIRNRHNNNRYKRYIHRQYSPAPYKSERWFRPSRNNDLL